MTYAQFSYLQRGKVVKIKGQLQQRVIPYLQTLIYTQKKFQFEWVQIIKKKINYPGNQFIQNILIMLLIACFSIANFFLFATQSMAGMTDMGIISIVLTRFIIITFVPRSWRSRVSIMPLILALIFLVFQLLNIFDNTNLTPLIASITILFGVFLMLDLIQTIWKQHIDQSNEQFFTFQANLMIAAYMAMKCYQVFLFENTKSAVLTSVCFSLINLIKISGLLQFQPSILARKIIRQNAKEDITKMRRESEKNQMRQAKDIGKTLKNIKSGKQLNAIANSKARQKNQKNQNTDNQELQINQKGKNTEETKSKETNKNQNSKKLIFQAANQPQGQYQFSKFSYSILIGAVLLQGTACFTAIYFYYQNNSEYVWYSCATIIKITIISLYAQIAKQNILKRFCVKNYIVMNMIINILGTLPMSALIIFEGIFKKQNDFFIINSIIGVLSLQTFHGVYFHMHQKRSNLILIPAFFLFVFTYVSRQLSMVTGSQIPSIVLGAIMGIAIVFLRIWLFKDVFLLLYEERIKSKANNNYSIYLLEKLKHIPNDFNPFNNFQFLTATIVVSFGFFYSSEQAKSVMKQVSIAVYFSFYYLFLLTNVFDNYTQQKIEQFKISKIPFVFTIGSIIYTIVSYVVFTQGDDLYHQRNCSLVTLVLCLIYQIMNQLSYFFVYHIPGYRNFIKILVDLFMYWVIIYPFIIGFFIGYLLSDLNRSFIYYYAIGCFIYISLVVTILGVVIHDSLNLTALTQKQLFIVKYMSNQMQKINLLPNSQKFLLISNYFEIYDQDPQKIIDFLHSQMLMKVVNHQDRNIEHDYSFQDINLGQTEGILTVIIEEFAQASKKQEESPPNQQISESLQQTNKTMFVQFETSPFGFLPQQNSNYLQLTRLLNRVRKIGKSKIVDLTKSKSSSIFGNLSKINPLPNQNYINPSIIDTQNVRQCVKMIIKLFKFLSEPSKGITQQTFVTFLQILEIEQQGVSKINQRRAISSKLSEHPQRVKSYNLAFNNFALNSQIEQGKFKDFVIDYTCETYELKKHEKEKIFKTFCKYQLWPIIQASQQRIKYHLLRKIIDVQDSQIEQWLKQQQIGIELLIRMKRQKAKKAGLLRKERKENDDQGDQDLQQAQKSQQKQKKLPIKSQKYVPKKDIQFKSAKVIYNIFVNGLVECFHQYQHHKGQGFNLQKISWSFGNIMVLVTKIIDYVLVFAIGTGTTLYTYITDNFVDQRSAFGAIDYKILLSLTVLGLIIYLAILLYHKKDFEQGTLGFDESRRTLTFRNFKFYTTTLIFILGTSFSTIVNNACLNAYLCDEQTGLLYNFQSDYCYNQIHFGYMIIALLVIIIYYPIALITFPFSSGTDRALEIKYKSQYQVIYLQCRFFISGVNVIFDPLSLKTQFFVVTMITFVICLLLFIASSRMKPCSYNKMNFIEPKVYFLLMIFNLAGCLCYFFGVMISSIIVGSLIVVYGLIMLGLYLYNSRQQQLDENAGNQIIQMRFAKQNNLKIQIKLQSKSEKGSQVQQIHETVKDYSNQAKSFDESIFNITNEPLRVNKLSN